MSVSYVYKAKARANFKTAYLVKEEVITAAVAADCSVGDVVTIGNEGTSSAQITPVTASVSDSASTSASENLESAAQTAIASISAGQLIIAQADMTMEYGHVPVEYRDYKYSPLVASTSTQKKLAVFRIKDVSDINKYAETSSETVEG